MHVRKAQVKKWRGKTAALNVVGQVVLHAGGGQNLEELPPHAG